MLSVYRCYFAAELRVVFTTCRLLPTTKKDVLTAFQHSNIIYQYLCHSNSRYVDRTSQWLLDGIKQHVPKSIRIGQFSQDRSALSHSCKSSNYLVSRDSAIGQHLLDNQLCALHFSTLEVTFIRISSNLISVVNKNLFTALKSFNSAFDFDWLLSRATKLSVSFSDAHRYINSVWFVFSSF